MHGVRKLLLALDRVAYQLERVILLVSVLMMIVLVFLDVVQRTFSRPVGKTEQVLIWLAGGPDASEATRTAIVETWGNLVFIGLALLFSIAATQSARTFAARNAQGESSGPVPFLPSVGIGTGVLVGLVLAVKGLLAVAPSGIPGAQKFALGFLVWSGFIGASLAVRARRHILIDAVKKKLGPDVQPWYSALGGLLTASFCAFLAWMAAHKTWVEIGEWSESDHTIHVFESLPVPTWLVTLALPVTLGMVSVRFLAAGLSELLYGKSLFAQADEHGIDFSELEREGQAPEEAAAAQAGTFTVGRPHPGGQR